LTFSFGLLTFSRLLLDLATLWTRVYPRGLSWFLLVTAVLAVVRSR
jgi:hypothetical protein